MWVFAVVAQLVEQHIRNVKVASSIPANGTKYSQQKKTTAQTVVFFRLKLCSPPACADAVIYRLNDELLVHHRLVRQQQR